MPTLAERQEYRYVYTSSYYHIVFLSSGGEHARKNNPSCTAQLSTTLTAAAELKEMFLFLVG